MYNQETIKSRDNAKLKLARRVRDGKEAGYIFIEGTRLCGEALSAGLSIVSCLISEACHGSRSFGPFESELRQVESSVISESLLESVSDTKTPQGIVMIAERPKPITLNEMLTRRANRLLPVWVYLHKVNNPSNLGAVLRTAEAASARGVILSPDSTDAFSPKSLRASMGSAFRLPIVNDVAIERMVSIAREKGIQITAVDAGGESTYVHVDWKTLRLLIFGSEAEGLTAEVLSRADETINIPMQANVESLNLAVSAGIILFEAKRQIQI